MNRDRNRGQAYSEPEFRTVPKKQNGHPKGGRLITDN